jgi:hypothetical protein
MKRFCREKVKMRAGAFFHLRSPRRWGGGKFFFCFSAVGEKRGDSDFVHYGRMADRDRNPDVSGIDVPIWNVKNILCFISEQKGKDFLFPLALQ